MSGLRFTLADGRIITMRLPDPKRQDTPLLIQVKDPRSQSLSDTDPTNTVMTLVFDNVVKMELSE